MKHLAAEWTKGGVWSYLEIDIALLILFRNVPNNFEKKDGKTELETILQLFYPTIRITTEMMVVLLIDGIDEMDGSIEKELGADIPKTPFYKNSETK